MIPRTLLLACLLPAVLGAAQPPEGVGIVYGSNHAFVVSAPKGWVLDNNSERNNGLHAVFYPEGSSWSKSKVVMYANTATKGEGQQTVAELIAFDTEQFRSKGRGLKVLSLADIATKDGKAVVKKFTGDQFGNSEAVAYINAPKVIVMLVLTSRDEAGFLANYPAFEKLVQSYKYLTDEVRIQP